VHRVGAESGQLAAQSKVPSAGAQTGVLPEHIAPHSPQLVPLARSASQPVPSIPSQSAKPRSHPSRLQVPSAQLASPFARLQVLPHDPQLELVSDEVSQPPIAMQSIHPGLQVSTRQTPATHSAEA
jgi:hypothetical protein